MSTILRIQSTFPAPATRVFSALTTPEDLNVWAWAGIGTFPRALVDLQVGGAYEISVDGGDAMPWKRPRLAMRGYFIDIQPPKRLVYTLHWDAPVTYNQTDDACPDECVIIELNDAPDNHCTMQYTHLGIPTDDAAAMHRQGIEASHRLLATHLKS